MKAEFELHCQKLFSIPLTLFVLGIALLSLAGCSGTAPSSKLLSSDSQWLADGSITISRPAPRIAPIQEETATLLGLLPGSVPALASPSQPVGTWIAVSRRDSSISVMDGSSTVYQFRGEGISQLKPGTYHLLYKQRNPLWYAPDSYFSKRSIPTPPSGDRARFRRGALGDFVLFLDKDTPIHSGPIWSEDIGGARLDENDISRVYYKVDIGSPIHVE